MNNATRLVTTPRNSLPSVATVWSDGTLTLHSVTGDYNPNPAERGEKKRRRGKRKRRRAGEPDPRLELRLMWRVDILANSDADGGEGTDGRGGGGV